MRTDSRVREETVPAAAAVVPRCSLELQKVLVRRVEEKMRGSLGRCEFSFSFFKRDVMICSRTEKNDNYRTEPTLERTLNTMCMWFHPDGHDHTMLRDNKLHY